MERRSMSSSVIPDIAPAELLARLRGEIFDAYPAHLETIQFKLRDPDGGIWWFSIDYADYSPSDPKVLIGKTVVCAELDERAVDLAIRFSDGSTFTALFIAHEPLDLETWTLFTPDDLCLTYGPGPRWDISRCDWSRYRGDSPARP
jgi:hypothetical protein